MSKFSIQYKKKLQEKSAKYNKMSQELHQLFNEFVKNSENDLADIDQQYPDDKAIEEKCAKYVKKLQIYEKFTDGLKDKSEHYLKVINELDDGLASLDELSSQRAQCDVSKDFDFIRNCIEKRAQCEEGAMDSLAKLESIVKSLLDQNKRMKSDGIADSGIASNVILNLNDDNKKIKDIIKRNKETMILLGSKDVSGDEDSNPSDHENLMSSLQAQLDEKVKIIDHLTNQIKNSTSIPKTTRRSQTQSQLRQPQRSRSEMSLSETEKEDENKLHLFKNAYKEMASILKEKYQQLRDKNEQIAELMRKLEEFENKKSSEQIDEHKPELDEKCKKDTVPKVESEDEKNIGLLDEDAGLRKKTAKSTEDSDDEEKIGLLDEDAELRQKKKKLSEESSDAEKIDLLDEDAMLRKKQASEEFDAKTFDSKQLESILARKFVLQETHIQTLRDERQKLIKLNNDMLNTIAICKEELSKYKIE